MGANWCAACGGYVQHNPHDYHVKLVDVLVEKTTVAGREGGLVALLRRISAHLAISARPRISSSLGPHR
jgi:hypothetical protein